MLGASVHVHFSQGRHYTDRQSSVGLGNQRLGTMEPSTIDNEVDEEARLAYIKEQGEMFDRCAATVEALNDSLRQVHQNLLYMQQSLQETDKLAISWLKIWKDMDKMRNSSSINKENTMLHRVNIKK